MMGREGSLITVSGQRQPQYAIEQDGLLRLRFLNASASRFYKLRLDEHPLHIIATDGGTIAAPQGVDELLLAPGERRDVLVQGRRITGSYRLVNLPYDRGSAGMMGGGTGAREIELATFVYQGRAERSLTIPGAAQRNLLAARLAFAPDANLIAVGTAPNEGGSAVPGEVTLYDPLIDFVLATIEGRASAMAFSPDGTLLAIATEEALTFYGVG